MPASPREVTEYLHTHIPLTRAMQVRATAIDEWSVRLAAPLDPNRNHRATVFGGSIAGIGILAGWTLCHLKLGEQGFRGRLVIQKSNVEFTAPIEGDFECVCACADATLWTRFFDSVLRRGKGRISLRSEIATGSRTAAVFDGTYVAISGRE